MSITYTCDGCGKSQPADKSRSGEPIKPHNWYARRDDDGEQHACSRECVKTTSTKSGKPSVILPI